MSKLTKHQIERNYLSSFNHICNLLHDDNIDSVILYLKTEDGKKLVLHAQKEIQRLSDTVFNFRKMANEIKIYMYGEV